ncbi:uncharacterized [Tachysurus ichikawai]
MVCCLDFKAEAGRSRIDGLSKADYKHEQAFMLYLALQSSKGGVTVQHMACNPSMKEETKNTTAVLIVILMSLIRIAAFSNKD